MWRYLPFMAVLAGVTPLACFRDLTSLICEDPESPACASASTTSSSSTTRSEDSTTGSSSTSTSTASAASTEGSPDETSVDPDTSSDTSADTTTGPVPYCGDGIVQPGPPLYEECDDSLSDAGNCNLLCKRDRVVFVASMPLFKAGGLQGIKGADNYCVSRAGMAGLPQFLLFRALLSDSQHDAGTRLFNGEGRYVLVDGTVVADDWASFITEPLQHPIELTEKGEVLHVSVWTGTEYGTGKLVPGANNCDDWTSNDLNKEAYWGRSNEIDSQWVYSNLLNPTDCLAEFSVYCVEQQ